MGNKYIPYLDGIRGISIILVILSHCGLGNIVPGGFGVTLFFFISGYLITGLLIQELQTTGSIQLFHFYVRRFFRLYPPLLAMIAIGCLLQLWLHCFTDAGNILAACFYFTNYFIAWVRGTVADCATMFDILWSLSIEEHFYLVYPLILLLASKSKKTWLPLFCTLVLCLLPLLFRIQLLLSDKVFSHVSGKLYLSTHTRADCILWGCLASVLLFQCRSALYQKILQKKWILVIAILLLLGSFCIRNIFFRESLRYTMQGASLFVLIPSLAFFPKSQVVRFLQNNNLIFIGKISYSLYLFHWIVLRLANNQATVYSLHWQLLFWLLSVLLALGSYYFIERPFMKLRRKFGSVTAK